MRALLAALFAALALAACSPLDTCFEERAAEARAVAGDIVPGTVRSVLAAPEAEEPWEATHLSYDDPLDAAPREQVVVRLDNGSEVTLLYAGPRRIEPGERVRVFLGGETAVLL